MMNKNILNLKFSLILVTALLIVFSCNHQSNEATEYNANKIYPTDTIIAVILSPAGSNVEYNFDPQSNKLSALQDTLTFLPFPANFGFIHQNKSENSINKQIPCIVIGKQIASLSPVGVRTIGAVEVSYRRNPAESFVVCVPNDPSLIMANISNFADLITIHDALKFQINHFLLNYKGLDQTRIVGWQDEKYANNLIRHNVQLIE